MGVGTKRACAHSRGRQTDSLLSASLGRTNAILRELTNISYGDAIYGGCKRNDRVYGLSRSIFGKMKATRRLRRVNFLFSLSRSVNLIQPRFHVGVSSRIACFQLSLSSVGVVSLSFDAVQVFTKLIQVKMTDVVSLDKCRPKSYVSSLRFTHRCA